MIIIINVCEAIIIICDQCILADVTIATVHDYILENLPSKHKKIQ